MQKGFDLTVMDCILPHPHTLFAHLPPSSASAHRRGAPLRAPGLSWSVLGASLSTMGLARCENRHFYTFLLFSIV